MHCYLFHMRSCAISAFTHAYHLQQSSFGTRRGKSAWDSGGGVRGGGKGEHKLKREKRMSQAHLE